MVACLELCGKSDNDITKLLDGADKRGDLGMDAFVPQRIQDYIDKAKVCIVSVGFRIRQFDFEVFYKVT